MLKKIPKILSPDLVKLLMEMGHGDEIIIADANFPTMSFDKKVIRADGIKCNDILKAILELFPLDSYSENQVYLMEVPPEKNFIPEIWQDYKNTLKASKEPCQIKHLERFAFYEQAEKACAIVATGEEAIYANMILKKGIV